MASLKQRNTRYQMAPHIYGKSRTAFDLSHQRKTTGKTGDLIPIYCQEVVPGDSWTIKGKGLARLLTSLHQTMDNAHIEIAYFYVPMRIIWDDFEKFYSGYSDNPWFDSSVYTTPQLLIGGSSNPIEVKPESLVNQLYLPAGTYTNFSGNNRPSITALPLRAVFQIYNDYFRNENYDSIISFSKTSTNRALGDGFTFNGGSIFAQVNTLKVNRYYDRFSTSLPAPQKGGDTMISLGDSAPVILDPARDGEDGMFVRSLGGDIITTSSTLGGNAGTGELGATNSNGTFAADIDPNGRLIADLSNAEAVTINNLRLAIASQALKETMARGGTRFNEYLRAVYNVEISDKTIQRAEFLTGTSNPMSMMEVLQTSETGTTAQGSGTGHSKTLVECEATTKSFEEPGYIIGFIFVRTDRSYSQGIDRQFFRKDRLDYYNPFFDNIGEVPVKKRELYGFGTLEEFDSVWGYQEAWYEYKDSIDRNAGFMQTGINETLETWHYGDRYESTPQISASWLKEGPENVDRTIAVQSSSGTQWFFDVYTEATAIRKMNKYSIPNTFGFGGH